jgi:hypothetical protein
MLSSFLVCCHTRSSRLSLYSAVISQSSRLHLYSVHSRSSRLLFCSAVVHRAGVLSSSHLSFTGQLSSLLLSCCQSGISCPLLYSAKPVFSATLLSFKEQPSSPPHCCHSQSSCLPLPSAAILRSAVFPSPLLPFSDQPSSPLLCYRS